MARVVPLLDNTLTECHTIRLKLEICSMLGVNHWVGGVVEGREVTNRFATVDCQVEGI